MSKNLLEVMPDKATVFNIPANYHFFESLFYWLEKNYNSEQISEVKIFLPNRRSCREFQRIFLRKKSSGILPKIKAISDISIDDFFDFLPSKNVKSIIDEILEIKVLSGIDYLFFLSKEIQKLAVFGDNLDFNQAFKIATHLQKLFDEIEREEIDLKKLEEIDDSTLSSHRQLTLDFLKNFHIQIKNSLLKKNIFFTTSYQNFIIQKFSELLKENGSKSPIIIAGSTGSVSFSKKLIKAISQQKNCRVILCGLSNDEKLFIEENHPQFFLNQLIKFLEIEKKEIKKIANDEFILSDESRQNLLSLMMLPSEETAKWQKTDVTFDAKNFRLIEAKNEIEEAKIIALLLKKNLSEQKNSALISNNDRLVSLVKSELHRFHLPFNDSRNLKIFNSKLINFLLLILELKEGDFDSHTLLAILKNPLCRYSQNQKVLTDFEIKILREERVKSGLAGLSEKLKILGDKNLSDFFSEFCDNFKILKQVQDDGGERVKDDGGERVKDDGGERVKDDGGERVWDEGGERVWDGDGDAHHDTPNRHPELVSGSLTLSSQTKLLIDSAQNLSQKTWSELLEKESAQIEIFEFFEKLKSQTDLEIEPRNLLKTFQTLLSQISFFEKSDSSSPIQILSPLEARLLNYDLVIIASLNEGSFPEIESENWLGKKIRKDLEIDKVLKKIGQSAYDFCNYLSNKSVILTRCKSSGGTILIESPFLLKLKTLCKKIGVTIDEGAEIFSILRKLNSAAPKEIVASTPKPKIEFRPKKFSITEISKLISDPYSIYAKKILQLHELEKIDFEPSYAEFGSFVHKALEEFIKNPNEVDSPEKLHKIFNEYFLSEEAKLIWWPKFENIFSDFKEKNEIFFGLASHLEVPIKLQLGEVLISGKIDRVICNDEGNAEIFDYKTGQIPSRKDVISGNDPQLTIAALALVEEMAIESLNYWKLSSSQSGEIKKICDKNEEMQILLSAAKAGLAKLFEHFAKEENGYIATKNNDYNEYKHLSRNAF